MFKYVSYLRKVLQRIVLTQLAYPQAVVILAIVACVAAWQQRRQRWQGRQQPKDETVRKQDTISNLQTHGFEHCNG